MTAPNLKSFLLISTISFLINCSADNSDSITSINNQDSKTKIDLSGVYIGYEEMFFTDENGITHTSYDLDNPQDKWYRQTILKIKGDSAFADQCAVIVRNKDTLYSSSDGGFYFWSGLISTSDSTAKINLTELFCDYCGERIERQSDGTYRKIKRKKTYTGLIGSSELIITNFKKVIHEENLTSEYPRPYLKNP